MVLREPQLVLISVSQKFSLSRDSDSCAQKAAQASKIARVPMKSLARSGSLGQLTETHLKEILKEFVLYRRKVDVKDLYDQDEEWDAAVNGHECMRAITASSETTPADSLAVTEGFDSSSNTTEAGAEVATDVESKKKGIRWRRVTGAACATVVGGLGLYAMNSLMGSSWVSESASEAY